MTKLIPPEALALRKMRELKNFDRRQAGIRLGLSHKTIEKLENGRAKLTPTKIDQIVAAYGFPTADFQHILAGNTDLIRERYKPKTVRIIGNNPLRRSYKRVITRDVQTLIALRRLKGYSQKIASGKCGYATCSIGHIENGRIELPRNRIEHIVKCYGFTMADFARHKASEVLVTDLQDECVKIIRTLPSDKLQTILPLLNSLKR